MTDTGGRIPLCYFIKIVSHLTGTRDTLECGVSLSSFGLCIRVVFLRPFADDTFLDILQVNCDDNHNDFVSSYAKKKSSDRVRTWSVLSRNLCVYFLF